MEHDLLERENRQRSEALAGKMGRLKDVSTLSLISFLPVFPFLAIVK